MEEEREEDKEKTLNPEHYISVMEADLEQENKFEDEEVFSRRVNHSCSHSPIEKYQNQRINSEIHHLAKINKHRFPRTASLDFNSHNATILSPQFSIGATTNLKKNSWTPNYQKGWSSERVPLHMNKRKQIPSKWEDAERWIGSPVSIDGNGRLVLPSYHIRQSKSKIGPHSTTVPCFDSGRVINVASNSPFLAGVLVGNPQCYGSTRGGNGSYVSEQQFAAASGCSDLSSESNTQGYSKEGSMMCSPGVILKDMGTQMSPSESAHSSPKERLVSVDSIIEVETHFSKIEIRDVEVDGQFTMIRRQKKQTTSDRCLRNIIEWKNTTEEDITSCSYNVTDPSKYLSIRDDRDEDKLGVWRNLQGVKAEEAIKKLELKLEKERCSSMDKILSKLSSTQKKAEDLRSVVRSSKSNQNRTGENASSGRSSFLKSCFSCQAS